MSGPPKPPGAVSIPGWVRIGGAVAVLSVAAFVYTKVQAWTRPETNLNIQATIEPAAGFTGTVAAPTTFTVTLSRCHDEPAWGWPQLPAKTDVCKPYPKVSLSFTVAPDDAAELVGPATIATDAQGKATVTLQGTDDRGNVVLHVHGVGLTLFDRSVFSQNLDQDSRPFETARHP